MRNALKLSALFVLVLALTGMTAWAQQGGGLQGRVVDEAGQPVIGATIQVSGPAVQGFMGAATDTSGSYIIPFLPVGRGYEVKVEAPGYNTVIRKGIEIVLGATANLPFALSQGKTEIVVTAAAPTLDRKIDIHRRIRFSDMIKPSRFGVTPTPSPSWRRRPSIPALRRRRCLPLRLHRRGEQLHRERRRPDQHGLRHVRPGFRAEYIWARRP